MASIAKATVNGVRRVRFVNDSDSLMNPLPTLRFIFQKGGIISEVEVEKVEPPKKRRRRLFGTGRSLAEMESALPSNPSKNRVINTTVEVIDPSAIIR